MTFARTWMPLDIDAFFESEHVATMSDSAALLYLWLLGYQFKNGDLPKPEVLRKLPHRWQSSWPRLWPQIEGRFEVVEEGRLRNRRCHDWRQDAIARANRARDNGKHGGRPRKNPDETQPVTNPVRQPEPSANPDPNPRESSRPDRTVPDRIGSERTEPDRRRESPSVLSRRGLVLRGRFEARFQAATSSRYAFEAKADVPALEKLAAHVGDDDALFDVRVDRFFEDAWHAGNGGWTLTKLAASWNTYAAAPLPRSETRSSSLSELEAFEREQEEAARA